MKIKNIRAIFTVIAVTIPVLTSKLMVYATDYIPKVPDENKLSIEILYTSNITTEEQIQELYKMISDEVGINTKYVKQLHKLCGDGANYENEYANIYENYTIEPIKTLTNNKNTVIQKAEFIQNMNNEIQRASNRYLPDVLYSISYDIASLMTQRYNYNRGGMKMYFDVLKDDVKQDILFYEAILLYCGENEETVNRFYNAYERIVFEKELNETIIYTLEDTDYYKYYIKDKYKKILNDSGIVNNEILDIIAKIMSNDDNIISIDSIHSTSNTLVIPYKPNYTSRENMMLAAFSLCGKSRYIWGGGHSGSSFIDGINPAWQWFESLYPKEPVDEQGTINTGFGTCIKESDRWCPLDNEENSDTTGEIVYSLEDYIELRKEAFGEDIDIDDYKEIFEDVNFEKGISIHSLDGFDCSGYAAWVYNQITDKYLISSTAKCFLSQNAVKEISLGEEMLPGDVFAWYSHIVIIVGKVDKNSKAYVTIEQTPNVLKFGVLYYENASAKDIALAKQIATEANTLIGNINCEYEKPHCYCIDTVKYYIEEPDFDNNEDEYEISIDENYEDELTEICDDTMELKEYAVIGRFKDKFIDEDTIINEDGKRFKDLTAIEIIQYTLNKMPISYVNGYNRYDGELFNVDEISSDLGIIAY